MPKPRVVERKLGREQADGIAYHPAFGDDKIEIHLDSRLPPRKKLKVLIHEALHQAYPEMSEAKVKRGAAKIADIEWRHGVRFVQK